MSDSDRPDENNDMVLRTGLCGLTTRKHDNGVYILGTIANLDVNFLIDSGSNSTLLSFDTYNSLGANKRPDLEPTDIVLMGVNGDELKVHGAAILHIEFGQRNFTQPAIVCNIATDAILGQDILLRHSCKLDYKKTQITIDDTTVPLWIGGEAEMVCYVLASETIYIPPLSSMFIEVVIPMKNLLTQSALIEPNYHQNNQVVVVPGVINTQDDKILVHVHNPEEREVTIYPNARIGTCQSLYLTEPRLECRVSSTENGGVTLDSIPVHLQDLWQRSITHLDTEERTQLAELLTSYQDVFSKSPEDLGRTNRVQHKINTGTALPIRQPLRRLPLGKKATEKEEINKMLKTGVIEPSRSPWSSSVVLVTKKDNSTRFCVDYRNLNEVTVRDAYPLPHISECLDSLEGKRWFSSLDLNSGFWQIGMAEEDKEKTAFSTSQGLYQFRVMPFGLTNSPSTFQRLMEDVLRGLQWEECLVYMDDIIVPATTVNETLERLQRIFIRFREANLKLKPKKCNLFQTSVKFLGHVVSEDGVRTDPSKIQAVRDWPVPKTAKQTKSFLGLASYYRRFIKGFAAIAKPLHLICDKGKKFAWSDECQAAFDELKDALTSAPILAYPNPGLPFILDTDASNYAVGAALSQVHDGKEHVIAYMSNTLNRHEVSYCVTRKELLAVVRALRCFHSYLYRQHVLLRTDNAAVSWMRSLKQPTGQVARWLQELGTYDLEVTHRPGHQHRNADALSRNPCKSCKHQEERNTSEDVLTFHTISFSKFVHLFVKKCVACCFNRIGSSVVIIQTSGHECEAISRRSRNVGMGRYAAVSPS